jgi:hypothetical protein
MSPVFEIAWCHSELQLPPPKMAMVQSGVDQEPSSGRGSRALCCPSICSQFFELLPVQQEKGPMAPFLLLRGLLER